jgi:NAD(P)H-dependent FMN reductase
MNILSFGASASKHSINKQFAHFVADQFGTDKTSKIDLIDFPLPVFTVDEEKENGFPANVHLFLEKIYAADLIVISMAEHNGTYTTWFKNLFDWASRVNTKFFTDKKILLLSTSPGPRGGIGALTAAEDRFPRHGAQIIATFSLPNFETNFSTTEGILNNDLKMELEKIISQVKAQEM